MKILVISDKVDPLLHSPALHRLYANVDMVLSCGDLPHYYLEYIVTMLGGPLFYVIGNHCLERKPHQGTDAEWEVPGGCEYIDRRVVRYRKLLIAGLGGSMRYNEEPDFQYTESEMAQRVWRLAPALLLNRLRYGRYLDILVTHAPAEGVHDLSDPCHRGFHAFRAFMERFRPRYLVHGHVHEYDPKQATETRYRDTTVLNVYGYRTIDIDEGTLR